MPGVRAKDKVRIGGWLSLPLVDRVRRIAATRSLSDTGMLNEALTEWADRNETAHPAGSVASPTERATP